MIRLQLKAQLINEINQISVSISRYAAATSKSIRKLAYRSIKKDFKKGLKEIDKKSPVFVELPTMMTESKNSYSEVREDKEIIVNSIENVIDEMKLLK